jgi:pilus assembly protein Flp/PilA
VTTLFAHMFALTVITRERLSSEDRGATAVEYGLLVGLIAVVIIGSVIALGGKLSGLFASVTASL